jgi:hypothetical protein
MLVVHGPYLERVPEDQDPGGVRIRIDAVACVLWHQSKRCLLSTSAHP